jgi:CMP-N,N'-diacetyllegionaminic acid synthase
LIKTIALIPARGGSKRIPHKNISLIDSHPLLAYTVRAAIDSKMFDAVVCVTDNEKYSEIARYYGAEVPELRPKEISGDLSPDIDWVKWILSLMKNQGRLFDIFSILRPTSPFRMPSSIVAAIKLFHEKPEADSLRAVEKCLQHPGKMWVVRNRNLLPILPFMNNLTPWHSSQYAALPEIYIQNASLEVAWSKTVFENNSIAGELIIPFFSEGLEGFDINNEEDIILANHYIANGKGKLPKIELAPYHVK